MLTATEIKFIRSLAQREARHSAGLFVVEGAKMVNEAVGSNMKVVRLFATDEHRDAEHISPKEMERISTLKTPSNMLAVVEMPTYLFDADIFSRELVLALDNIQDPGNVGTILRTADWFGIRNIFCSHSTADCFNPKVIQATMGAIFRVAVQYGDLIEMLKDITTPIYGTFLDGDNIYDTPLSSIGVIVMGNEGQGISDMTAKFICKKLYIPSYNSGTESLNVASATAVVLSEFRRRRRS